MKNKTDVIEVKGKHFIFTAHKLEGSANRYIIRRGKNVDGEFVEYSNMFETAEDRKPRTFKNRSDVVTYLKTLANLQDELKR